MASGGSGRGRDLPKGADLLAAAIAAGRGAVLLTEAGTPELARFHRCAAAAGRADDIRILDLSRGTAEQGLHSRRLRVVPDLDALTGTSFAADVLTALASSTAIQEFPLPTPRAEPEDRRGAILVRAQAAEAPGPGAWDRVMARVAREPVRGFPVSPAARAGTQALLRSDTWPGLDGTTPRLDLEEALADGLTLVLVGGPDDRRSPAEIDRRHLAAIALANLFAEGVRPGGATVVMSRWASQLFAYERNRIERGAPAGAVPPSRLANEALAVVPDGSPDSRPARRSGHAPSATAAARRDGEGARFLLVDPFGWPSFLSGPAPAALGLDPDAAAADLARGAVAPGMPFGFRLDLSEFTAWGLRGCLGLHPMMNRPAWPEDGASPAAGIDRDLVLACETAEGGSLLHAWVRAGDAVRRRQFVLAWQALADLGRTHGLGAAIDAGEPSLPLIAGILGLDEARTRRFVGLPRPFGPYRTSIPRIAGRMRVDRLPAAGDAGAWDAFRFAAETIADLMPEIGRVDPPAHAVAFLDRCGRNRWRDAGAPGLDARGLRDAATGLLRLCQEATGTDDNYDLGLSMLLDAADMGALSVVERAWHADPVLRRGSSHDLPPDTAWPALFDGPVRLGNGAAAHALGSLHDLVCEGGDGPDPDGHAGLDHCVASYARACLAGECAIVSIRDAAGDRLSTAEVLIRPDGPVVVQHRGRGNAEPGPAAAEALALLVARIASGDVPTRRGFSGTDPDRRRGDGEPLDPGTRRAVLDDLARRWSRILPAPWRHDGFEPLAAAIRQRAVAIGALPEAEPPAPGP